MLISFFLSDLDPFYLSCLIALVRTSSTILNKSGDSGHLILCLVLKEKLSIFHHWVKGFLIYGLNYVVICFFFIQSVWSCDHEMLLYFIKCFFCTYWDGHVIFVFHSLMYPKYGWHMLKHSCMPGINLTWSWFKTLLMFSWIQFSNKLLRFFASIFIREGPVYFFLKSPYLVLLSG